MLNKLKNWFSPFFALSKSEQRGIILFSFLILAVLIFRLTMPLFINEEPVDNSKFIKEMEAFYQAQQHLSDSIQIERLQNRGELDKELATRKLNPFPFNPNQLPEEQWILMGLTPKQAKSIKNYETKGGKFKSKADVKKMYAISDIEYQILEPFILIPETEKPEKTVEKKIASSQPVKEYPPKKIRQNIEINTADSAMLVDQLLLSPWVSGRVVKYGKLLGGYYNPQQLSEVYGLKPNILQASLPFIQVDTLLINKIDLNKASFKEILHHPYISYEMTQAIVNKRERKGKYKSVNELIELNIVPDTVFSKLRPYLIVSE